MIEAQPVAELAGLLADPTRSEMLLVLMDGRAYPVTDLAAYAHVGASTASYHLDLLVSAGLVESERRGRHRYHRITRDAVAELIEHMGAAFPVSTPRPRLSRGQAELGSARACYSHLAGNLGVGIRESLESCGHLVLEGGEYRLTPSGLEFFEPMGVSTSSSAGKACLDWTERVPHIGGALGRAIFAALLEREWIVRGEIPRQIKITSRGFAGFQREFPGSLALAESP
jgi:DNA-binding transcriptional ArsR family regulator